MAEPQSWIGWMLSPFTGSATSEAPATTSTPSNDPYVRVGRGGAGNFTWQSELSDDAQSSVESQKPLTLSERRENASRIEHLDMNAAMRSQESTRAAAPQYVRVGRGYVPRNQIQPRSPTQSSAGGSDAASEHRTPQATIPAYTGRGGAGNFAAAAAVKEQEKLQREEQERLTASRLREQAAERVQNEIPAPPDAWLGSRTTSK